MLLSKPKLIYFKPALGDSSVVLGTESHNYTFDDKDVVDGFFDLAYGAKVVYMPTLRIFKHYLQAYANNTGVELKIEESINWCASIKIGNLTIKNFDLIFPRNGIKCANDMRICLEAAEKIGYKEERSLVSFAFNSLRKKMGWCIFSWDYLQQKMCDEDKVRKAVSAGLFLAKDNTGVEHTDIISIDVNSLYPSIVLNERLPTGKCGVKFGYKRVINNPKAYYHFYEIKFTSCQLIDGKLDLLRHPTRPSYSITELDQAYSKTLMLSQDDYDYLVENYLGNWSVYRTYTFRTKMAKFRQQLEAWRAIKIDEQASNAEKYCAKVCLNGVIGKFAQTRHLSLDHYDIKGARFPALTAAVHAKGRKILREAIHVIGWDNFVYCDTDSIKFSDPDGSILEEIRDRGWLDPQDFGKWKVESIGTKLKVFGIKQYVEKYRDGSSKLTLAGASGLVTCDKLYEDIHMGTVLEAIPKTILTEYGARVEMSKYTVGAPGGLTNPD